jgi:hypothetical protein
MSEQVRHEDKIGDLVEVAAQGYVAELRKIWEEFGGFPRDFYIAGARLCRAMFEDAEDEHVDAFIEAMQDEVEDEVRSWSEEPGPDVEAVLRARSLYLVGQGE